MRVFVSMKFCTCAVSGDAETLRALIWVWQALRTRRTLGTRRAGRVRRLLLWRRSRRRRSRRRARPPRRCRRRFFLFPGASSVHASRRCSPQRKTIALVPGVVPAHPSEPPLLQPQEEAEDEEEGAAAAAGLSEPPPQTEYAKNRPRREGAAQPGATFRRYGAAPFDSCCW